MNDISTLGKFRSDRWLIWSEEHGAWWRSGRSGYTEKLAEAGRYTMAEAFEIVRDANHYLPMDKWNEAIFPVETMRIPR